jgi:predicted peptidase
MRKILIVSLVGTAASLAAPPEAREWKAPNGTVVKYRHAAPARIEAGKTYPLVLFLHGAGERGDDNTAQLKRGVTAILKGAEKIGEPCFLIAPQCPAGKWWTTRDKAAKRPNELFEGVLTLVEETMKAQPVDPKRFYVTGISMGGYGTWSLLGRVPEKIAAAVPICGGGDPSLAARFKEVPIWAFHGEADTTVPVKATREMIAALEKVGGKPKSTFYPNVNHNSWTQTYANPEVIRWIFAQRRP